MYQMTHRIRYLVFLLLLAFSAVVVGEATNRDIVLVLDKGTDLRSIKNEIGTIFEQLNTAENNARIAVIGFDAVVTDIASLSLASEGGGKVLLDALTNEEAISSSANVAAEQPRSSSISMEPHSKLSQVASARCPWHVWSSSHRGKTV
jgi:hypothetical protein